MQSASDVGAPPSRGAARGRGAALMNQGEEPPDVDRRAQSMLMPHGHTVPPDEPAPAARDRRGRSWSKAPAFADDPERAAEVHEATQADRTRYLTSGLQPVDCRFCHATVNVKRLGPGHTAVQWNTE